MPPKHTQRKKKKNQRANGTLQEEKKLSPSVPLSVDYYVILDFEATCDHPRNPYPQEITEFPSVLLDAHTLREVSRFQQYVLPVHHPKLSEFCTNLTGITTQKLQTRGTDIKTTIKRYNTWLAEQGCLGNNFIIITCGNWDLNDMFPEQCRVSGLKSDSHFKRWLNIKDCLRDWQGLRKVGGMKRMLDLCGMEFEGRPHSGIDDCHNIARIWVHMLSSGFVPTESNISRLETTQPEKLFWK